MLRLSRNLIVLLFVTMAALAGEPSVLEQNVFLSESGWNRAGGVLQYNSFFGREATAVEITHEWGDADQRHQWGWTLPLFSDGGVGAGDLLLNYRYQLAGGGDRPFALAPRVSAVLPTRTERFGEPVRGLELAVPLSIAFGERLELHTLGSLRWIEGAGREFAAAQGVTVQTSARSAFVLDAVFTACPGSRQLIVRPALQWSVEAGGVRLNPAVALPLGADSPEVMFLLGIEHDF
jgi:hypothetical protein